MTAASADSSGGPGLVATARDTMPRDGATHSFVAGFAEVEVDTETGKYRISTTSPWPTSEPSFIRARSAARFSGRSMLGIGHAIGQKWVYDQHYGLPLAKRFHHNKPPTILDAPGKDGMGRARHSRSRNARRRQGHRRAARRRGLHGDYQCPLGRARRRSLPPRARNCGYHSYFARTRASGEEGLTAHI